MVEHGPYQNRPVHKRPSLPAGYDINDQVDWLLDIKQNRDILAAVVHASACGCARCHQRVGATQEWYRTLGVRRTPQIRTGGSR